MYIGSRGIVLCSENKGADQRLCFRICKKRFSHDEAEMYLIGHTLMTQVTNVL